MGIYALNIRKKKTTAALVISLLRISNNGDIQDFFSKMTTHLTLKKGSKVKFSI